MDVDLKILSIGIEITLQIIKVIIKIVDITTISLKASFSINITRGFERWTKNTFIFTNSLNHLECNSLLRNSHALISTNDLSNLGNPILESIYYGIPIISLNDQSLDSFLTSDVDSKLIDINHDFDKNLALAIQQFTEDEDYYSKIKNAIKKNKTVNSLEYQQQNEYLEIQKILNGVK